MQTKIHQTSLGSIFNFFAGTDWHTHTHRHRHTDRRDQKTIPAMYSDNNISVWSLLIIDTYHSLLTVSVVSSFSYRFRSGDVQMTHIDRVLGICLIHATGTTPGLLGSLKDKVCLFTVWLSLYGIRVIVFLSHERSCDRNTASGHTWIER